MLLATLAIHRWPSGRAPPSIWMVSLMKVTDRSRTVVAEETFRWPWPQLGYTSHMKDLFLGHYHNWCFWMKLMPRMSGSFKSWRT